MTAETSQRVGVAEVVRVGVPFHLQVGEGIAIIDGEECLTRRVDIGFALRVYFRIGAFVIVANSADAAQKIPAGARGL